MVHGWLMLFIAFVQCGMLASVIRANGGVTATWQRERLALIGFSNGIFLGFMWFALALFGVQ